MRSDALAYSRAASVSLFGIGAQLVLWLALLGYALFGRDGLASSAAWMTLIGLPAWVGLLLTFHQHKLERLEDVEAEAFAGSTAQQASVFQDADADLRMAAKRLRWMHGFLLPAVSIVMAAAFLIVGYLRFGVARELTDPLTFLMPASTGWAVAVGLGVGVIGFIFARFVAGMAQQKTWVSLRAGAVQAVGASLAGLSLAVGQGVAYLGSDSVYKILLHAIPVLMLIIGAEIILNFVLNIYRPRRAGEYPRPAFESRILGFVSAPDRIAESISDAINYQFGWDVSATWFYQLLSRSLVGLFSLALVLLWLLTSLAVVQPDERGLVLRHGEIARAVESGLHLKRPWPLETIETYPALHVNQITVGAESHADHDHASEAGAFSIEPILWTESHGEERLTVIQPAVDVAAGGEGDLSLLVIEAVVQYEVENLEAYMRLAADSLERDDPDLTRRSLLEAEANRVLVRFASGLSVSQILGPDRERLNEEFEIRLRAAYANLGQTDPVSGAARGAGVRILFAGIANAHPPSSEGVASAFEQVVSAEQERQAHIERAQTDAINELAEVAGDPALARRIDGLIQELQSLREAGADAGAIIAKEAEIQSLLESAGGDAAVLIASARAERWERHMQARGRAIRHNGRVELFRAAPAPYLAQRYLATISEAVAQARLFVTALEDPSVRFNFEELESNLADPFTVNEARDF